MDWTNLDFLFYFKQNFSKNEANLCPGGIPKWAENTPKIARTAKFCAVKKQGEKGPENPILATIFHFKFTEKQNFARMKNMARNNDHFLPRN